MTNLFIVFLLTLLVAAGFFAYLFNYLRNNHSEAENEPGELGARDLQEMAKLLNGGGVNNARLVIEQLTHRKLKGRKAVDILTLRMRAFCKLKEYHNAMHCAQQLVQQPQSRFITEMELIEHMAEIYAALGHSEKSYNEYLVLMHKRPNNAKHIFGAASQALEMKQYETAASLCEKVLKLRPDHHACQTKLGRIFYERKLYTRALDYLGQAYSGNYDSNELRYYLALTLMQTSGKDMAALSLLQRVAEDPSWTRQALPRLVKLSAKLGNHREVISSTQQFCTTFGREMSESVLNELKMLRANAHRYLHELEKACQLWSEIDLGTAYYEEAQDHIAMFRVFTEPGVFLDYVTLGPGDFVDLCTKVCHYNLKSRAPKSLYKLESRTLKVMPELSETSEDSPSGTWVRPISGGAIILQIPQIRWAPDSGKPKTPTPACHIFLHLDQDVSDADLQANLRELGIGQEEQDPKIDIHIYAFHLISPLTGAQPAKYNIHEHQPSEFRLLMLGFREQYGKSSATGRGSARLQAKTGADRKVTAKVDADVVLPAAAKHSAREILEQSANSAGFRPAPVTGLGSEADQVSRKEARSGSPSPPAETQAADLIAQLGEAKQDFQLAKDEAGSEAKNETGNKTKQDTAKDAGKADPIQS
ncbi:hypothetical protein P0082_10795 [Candidatus Haliotispira prima]|uniref:Tetratricopeptide repeat protein n=1 Tax=Candidatus Haliotispira prima TaxID=3034016 RepID=A0ABY8MGC6_9SPIO|nr:hypothetical protein P0082_10795 [Candidatus Haliotispira prima]